MKIVKSYQTSDGQLFGADEQENARLHELTIMLRGVIQSGADRSQPHYTSTEIAQNLCRNRDNIYKIISSFKKSCAGSKGGRKKQAVSA